LTEERNVQRTKAPFRADQVGSFLRSEPLKEARAKGVAAQNADDKWIAGRGECLRGPFHEAREVKEKNGLNLIFRRRIGRTQAVHAHNEPRGREQDQPQGHPQYRHVNFP